MDNTSNTGSTAEIRATLVALSAQELDARILAHRRAQQAASTDPTATTEGEKLLALLQDVYKEKCGTIREPPEERNVGGAGRNTLGVKPPGKAASAKSAKSGTGAKLKMPSSQAGKFTTAHKRLLELKDMRDAEAVVVDALEKAEHELKILKEQVDLVLPLDVPQQRYKDEWLAKNVYDKETLVKQVRQAVDRRRRDDRSTTSSMRLAAIEAEAEEAALLLQQRQLSRKQEQRRRQWQEEERRSQEEQDEQDRLEVELERVRARRDAFKHSAAGSSRASLGEQQSVVELEPVRQWLESAPLQPVEDRQARDPIDHSVPLHTGLLQHVLLAQAKLPMFKGDQLEFVWFMKAFQTQVEAVTVDPARKLHLLLQQLEGEPHTLVKACLLAPDPGAGLTRAKELLHERYGNPISQGLAFKKKLIEWAPIRSANELSGFSVQLQLCLEMKANGRGLGELDSAATLFELANKLSYKLRSSWQNRVVAIKGKELREVQFKDFVEFVRKHEKAQTHPVFGKLDTGSRDGPRKDKAFATVATVEQTDEPHHDAQVAAQVLEQHDSPQTVLATATNERKEDSRGEAQSSAADAFKPPCLFCKGNHPTSQCAANTLTRDEKRIRLRGLCFSCLKPGHSARKCRFRLKCDHCQGLHPTVLHEENPEAVAAQSPGPGGQEGGRPQERSLATATSPSYAIATVPVRLWTRSQKASVVVRALLDPASTATFVSHEAAELLGASPEPALLSLSTMARQDEPTTVGLLQNLRVADVEGNNEFVVNTTYVVDKLPVQEQPITASLLTRWPYLADVPWDWENADVPLAMLIRLNVHDAIAVTQSVRSPTGKGPTATRSALGWSLQGPINDRPVDAEASVSVNWVQTDEIQASLTRMYYADFEDAFDFSSKGLSRDDRAWIERAEQTASRLSNGKYEVELPFRNDGEKQMSDNYSQAYQRLQSLKRKFASNPAFHKDYTDFLQKMVDNGHVERVPEPESRVPRQAVNYVPHHGVYHPRKPGKIRVVFNCASRYKGVSLNDCLISGPDLTNSIVAVLLRFRQHPVAYMGDIEAMFYQVQVPARQRDMLRFLWWPGGAVDQDVVAYRMKVHLFGATSSPSVANFALRRAAEQAKQEGLVTKETQETVFRNFYVDDCLVSRRNEEDAAETARQLVRACKYGGFRLTKFVSTSVRVLQSFEQTELAKDLVAVDLSDDKTDPLGSLQERALGVAWSVAKDEFVFRAAQDWTEEAVTKRIVLSQLSKVYDPLGLAAPVVIVARILFRELNGATSRVDWDTVLPDDTQERWKQWRKSLKALESTRVPRCYTTRAAQGQATDTYQLHTFCDASTKAYAAVAFLRKEDKGHDDMHEVAFVFGKARVAPPKTVTVPRLELTAAKLAAELANNVTASLELKISRRVFWSDSTTVLKYLNNESRRFHVFVSNRINSILHLSEPHEWRYVPTKLNLADKGTRGVETKHLSESIWIRGPDFLRAPEDIWPQCGMPYGEIAADDPELRQDRALVTQCIEQDNRIDPPFVPCIIEHYSTAFRVRRAVAVWSRFCAWIRHRKRDQGGPLSLRELKEAEVAILRVLQEEVWGPEVLQLQRGQSTKKRSPLHRLNPQVVEGVVQSQGRAGWNVPIVPPGAYARLLVREAHERQLHLGRQSTAADVLRRYHIIGLNKIVREVLRACPKCQILKAQPGQNIMAPLPPFRTAGAAAFETMGIDYFGPFLVNSSPDEGQRCKAYGVIFSCAATRAVHLEVAVDLSSAGFINALRRFVARRGNAKRILSDNGTNFKGADKELRDELRKQRRHRGAIEEDTRCLEVEWQFSPPAASHFGGFWERIIRIVRQMLDIQTRHLSGMNLDAFHMLLCECEAILNDRPLTAVNLTNAEDDLEALTPNHLLLGRPGATTVPPTTFARASGALRNRWKCVQHAATQFWRRWIREYRVLLQAQSKWFIRKKNLKIDDIVLVVDPVKPRAYWKLGRVVATHPGRDGVVRVVDVRTNTGIVQRPITKLCHLEAASYDNGTSVNDSST